MKKRQKFIWEACADKAGRSLNFQTPDRNEAFAEARSKAKYEAVVFRYKYNKKADLFFYDGFEDIKKEKVRL